MVAKTALITLISTLLLAVLALGFEQSGKTFGPEPPVAAKTGASQGWGQAGRAPTWGGASAYSGASRGVGASGSPTWGGTSAYTGASRGYGGRGFGDDDHDDDYGDDDYGEWDDD